MHLIHLMHKSCRIEALKYYLKYISVNEPDVSFTHDIGKY